jgi:hypothetical protein
LSAPGVKCDRMARTRIFRFVMGGDRRPPL